ncbi:MAG: Holliday junction branch migration protein RuvA [Gammaproteobacteria bacterium]|nr:MAG: Holliday junction branch migration protein RuvA [Gammaproteobacteria bacterium]
MIALLHGTLRHKKAPFLIIECSGVGYEVETTLTAFAKLPDINEKTTIYTHLSIRDDAHVLFGFASLNERDLFRVLIKVNGIGPKMAIAILSGMNPDELAGVIAAEDSTALTKLPGIGKKTAERLIVELKDKFKHITLTTNNSGTPGYTDKQAKNDAIEALVQLGYKVNEAEKMVESVYQADINSGELIRLALQAKLKVKG